MATTTALSPDSSAATTGNPILEFVRSLLLYLLDVLHRALKSLSRNRNSKANLNPNKTPSSPPVSQKHPAASASFSIEHHQKHHLSRLATTATNPPPSRMQPTKVMPAVPLPPPPVGVPSPEKNTKENSLASPGNVARPQQLHRQDPTRSDLADITTSLARLGTVDVNGVTGNDSRSLSPSGETSTTSSIPVSLPCPPLPISEPLTGEKAVHSGFMREALDMARLALMTNETPVGCVLVHNGRVIAKGMNATNITRNGTRHAELMAISALISFEPQPTATKKAAPQAPASEARRRKRAKRRALASKTNDAADTSPAAEEEETSWAGVEPSTGYLYPYGQKLHPSARVDPSIISECVLYVTVEPCVMCASLLRQLRIRKVYFGAVNDKFGGTGGVFRIHMNAHETVAATIATAPPSPRLPAAEGNARPPVPHRSVTCNGEESADSGTHDTKGSEFQVSQRTMHEQTYLGGHGGNVEPGFEAEGGWGRDEAVTLLRQFYVQENGRAPMPRKKEGRAARLAVMLERDGHAGGPMIQTLPGEEGTTHPSPSTSATEPITPVGAMASGGLTQAASNSIDAGVSSPV